MVVTCLCDAGYTSLRVRRKFRNKRMRLLVSVTVLSTDRQLLNRFSCNLLLQNCVAKICRLIVFSVKTEQQKRAF
jgi:hypothetical protein